MNRILAWAGVISLAFVAPSRAASRPQPPAQLAGQIVEQIKTVEAQRFQALTRGDVQALDRLISDDLVYTHATGWRQNKSEFLGSVRSGELNYHSFAADNEKLSVYGDTVVVTGHATAKVTAKGQELDVGLLFLEVYARKDGRWQLVAWQSTRPPQ